MPPVTKQTVQRPVETLTEQESLQEYHTISSMLSVLEVRKRELRERLLKKYPIGKHFPDGWKVNHFTRTRMDLDKDLVKKCVGEDTYRRFLKGSTQDVLDVEPAETRVTELFQG